MPYTGVKSQWEDGNLVFYDNSGNEIARFDEGNSALDIATFLLGNTEVTATAGELNILDGVTATAEELNNAADVSVRVEEVTTDSTDVTVGVQSVEFNNDAVETVGATIADAANHQGLFIVKDVSNDNTQNHTLTLTVGTFNGTNNVATLNAAGEALVVYFDSNGDGTIVENVGSVALS